MSEAENPLGERETLKLDRLELALKASNEGIWDWWIDRQEIYYSRRILEFLECGSGRAPHLFLAPYSSIHPEDLALFQSAVERALADSGPETLAADARVLTGGGEWRWLRIRGTVVRDRAGKPVRIAGSMINISLRKQAEAQVEDERFLLRQLIDHIPVHVYFKDLQSQFVMANTGMAEWMGVDDASKLVGLHDRDFFAEEHWKPAEIVERQIIQTGTPVANILEHETWNERSGTWVMTSKFPWRDRRGQIKGTFGVSSNVTDIIEAQRRAEELAEELSQKNQIYEEELQLAREIQHAFTMRDYPTVADASRRIGFGSRYVPISGLAGDFFEIIPFRQNTVGVLICDVMGHGVRSALIVAMMRGLIEVQRAHAGEPAKFLSGLNEGLASILERANTTMFATAFYGVLNLSKATLDYACAGHPGPIIDGPEGVRQIAAAREQRGPGLGISRSATYPTNRMPLAGIRRMVLFTDGVLEAENQQGEPFFENRLIEIIAAHTNGPLDGMLDNILDSVLAFSQADQFNDDVCLLGIDISPS
jgi:sigma-B regulation protein RsbU (phosphoserine phosphatase)